MLFLIIFLTSCSSPIKNLDSQGENIICFGDSITYGAGAEKGRDYPSILAKLIGRNVINTGVSGDTTSSALNRVVRDVLERDPYLVIVELGGNDFLQGLPKEETLANLRKIILKIQKKGSAVALADVSCGVFLSGYRKDYKRLAKETGSILIPRLLGGILDNPSLKSDNIHPNSSGYKIIARRVYKSIKSYLK